MIASLSEQMKLSFEGVARSHARAARERRRECAGWRKKRILFFLLSSRSLVLLQLSSLATRNGEFKLKQEDLSNDVWARFLIFR